MSCVSTSQSWATRCIQVPMLEMRAPMLHRRKLKLRSERKVPVMGFFMRARRCCPVELAEVARGHDADEQRSEAEGYDVAVVRRSKAPTRTMRR